MLAWQEWIGIWVGLVNYPQKNGDHEDSDGSMGVNMGGAYCTCEHDETEHDHQGNLWFCLADGCTCTYTDISNTKPNKVNGATPEEELR